MSEIKRQRTKCMYKIQITPFIVIFIVIGLGVPLKDYSDRLRESLVYTRNGPAQGHI